MTPSWVTIDGNEAAVRIAHKLSEVIAIYPITPSTPMGEQADAWSEAGQSNLWGTVPLWSRCSPRAARPARSSTPERWGCT